MERNTDLRLSFGSDPSCLKQKTTFPLITSYFLRQLGLRQPITSVSGFFSNHTSSTIKSKTTLKHTHVFNAGDLSEISSFSSLQSKMSCVKYQLKKHNWNFFLIFTPFLFLNVRFVSRIAQESVLGRDDLWFVLDFFYQSWWKMTQNLTVEITARTFKSP